MNFSECERWLDEAMLRHFGDDGFLNGRPVRAIYDGALEMVDEAGVTSLVATATFDASVSVNYGDELNIATKTFVVNRFIDRDGDLVTYEIV